VLTIDVLTNDMPFAIGTAKDISRQTFLKAIFYFINMQQKWVINTKI